MASEEVLLGSHPAAGSPSSSHPPADEEVPKLYTFPAKEIAEEMTLLDANLLRMIKSSELENGAWMKKEQKEILSPNIMAMVKSFNRIALLVPTEILEEDTPQARAKVIMAFIKVAKECYSLGNYNSLKAVLAGLQSTPIFRLHLTWGEVSSKRKRKFDQLSALMHEENNWSMYRQAIAQKLRTNSPFVPFLGVFLTTTAFAQVAASSGRETRSKTFSSKVSKVVPGGVCSSENSLEGKELYETYHLLESITVRQKLEKLRQDTIENLSPDIKGISPDSSATSENSIPDEKAFFPPPNTSPSFLTPFSAPPNLKSHSDSCTNSGADITPPQFALSCSKVAKVLGIGMDEELKSQPSVRNSHSGNDCDKVKKSFGPKKAKKMQVKPGRGWVRSSSVDIKTKNTGLHHHEANLSRRTNTITVQDSSKKSFTTSTSSSVIRKTFKAEKVLGIRENQVVKLTTSISMDEEAVAASKKMGKAEKLLDVLITEDPGLNNDDRNRETEDISSPTDKDSAPKRKTVKAEKVLGIHESEIVNVPPSVVNDSEESTKKMIKAEKVLGVLINEDASIASSSEETKRVGDNSTVVKKDAILLNRDVDSNTSNDLSTNTKEQNTSTSGPRRTMKAERVLGIRESQVVDVAHSTEGEESSVKRLTKPEKVLGVLINEDAALNSVTGDSGSDKSEIERAVLGEVSDAYKSSDVSSETACTSVPSITRKTLKAEKVLGIREGQIVDIAPGGEEDNLKRMTKAERVLDVFINVNTNSHSPETLNADKTRPSAPPETLNADKTKPSTPPETNKMKPSTSPETLNADKTRPSTPPETSKMRSSTSPETLDTEKTKPSTSSETDKMRLSTGPDTSDMNKTRPSTFSETLDTEKTGPSTPETLDTDKTKPSGRKTFKAEKVLGIRDSQVIGLPLAGEETTTKKVLKAEKVLGVLITDSVDGAENLYTTPSKSNDDAGSTSLATEEPGITNPPNARRTVKAERVLGIRESQVVDVAPSPVKVDAKGEEVSTKRPYKAEKILGVFINEEAISGHTVEGEGLPCIVSSNTNNEFKAKSEVSTDLCVEEGVNNSNSPLCYDTEFSADLCRNEGVNDSNPILINIELEKKDTPRTSRLRKVFASNFKKGKVDYQIPPCEINVETDAKGSSRRKKWQGKPKQRSVTVRGKEPLVKTMSGSLECLLDAVNIKLETEKREKMEVRLLHSPSVDTIFLLGSMLASQDHGVVTDAKSFLLDKDEVLEVDGESEELKDKSPEVIQKTKSASVIGLKPSYYHHRRNYSHPNFSFHREDEDNSSSPKDKSHGKNSPTSFFQKISSLANSSIPFRPRRGNTQVISQLMIEKSKNPGDLLHQYQFASLGCCSLIESHSQIRQILLRKGHNTEAVNYKLSYLREPMW